MSTKIFIISYFDIRLIGSSNLIVAASYTYIFSGLLNIFMLWTQQDILGRHRGLWETPVAILLHFMDQTTNRLDQSN